ncbi:MAG: GNAT family N-acetyltransferase [Thermaerobacter sp.]|nr:GNAT family N-acetyltransferase [Thermaerobacter sp.]
MDPIIVRQAQVQDAAAVAEQRRDYYAEETGNASVADDFVERMSMFVRQAIEHRDATVWIAEHNDRLISIAWVKHIRKVPWPDPWEARWAYVTDVYTYPPYRGRGVGAQLMKRVQQWAQDEGLEFLILWPSDSSVRWYSWLGFTPNADALVWRPSHPSVSIPQARADGGHSIVLRRLGNEEQDWERLAAWFASPHVREFYREDFDIRQVRAKFGPRTQASSRVRPRMILHDATPVGYAQFYPLTDEDVRAYQLPNTMRWGGFDLIIGDKTLWGRGIGHAVIQQLLGEIAGLGLSHVAIDTACHNLRAIGLYQKMGFEMDRVLKGWEQNQNHVLMTRELR